MVRADRHMNAGSGGDVPRAEDVGRLRLVVQHLHQEKQIFDLATCRFIERHARFSGLAAGNRQKSSLSGDRLSGDQDRVCRPVSVHLRCVRDFLHDEALAGQDKVLARYLKPDLLIVDDMA